MQNDNKVDMLHKAQDFFDRIKDANNDFNKRVKSAANDINNEFRNLETNFDKLEKQIGDIEHNVVGEIDAVTMDFLLESDQIFEEKDNNTSK